MRPTRQSNALSASFPVRDYDLRATLTSGQAFRWRAVGGGWEGVIDGRWVRLEAEAGRLRAVTAAPVNDWEWLRRYLQLEEDLEAVLAAFPQDAPLQAAVTACRGLRLLRQDPWECLASFLLSSCKQIVQIQQVSATLCERYGVPVAVPRGTDPGYAFPAAARLAACSERELRRCKMGFRAPHLLAAARRLAAGELDLAKLASLPLEQARRELMELPGVGPKIADCVLLFGLGFQTAFPIDVWVRRSLQQLYFAGRSVTLTELRRFSETHFGPRAGYAQQYLFHYTRTNDRNARLA